MSSRRARWLLLLALALVSHALYASLVPPWQAPDEPAHFEVAELIHEKGRPVTLADRGPGLQPEIVASLDRNKFFQYIPWAIRDHVIQAHQLQQFQQLYYAVASLTWWIAAEQPIEIQLVVMRMISALMNLGMVVVALLTMERLEPQDGFLQWTVPAFVGLLPMSTFISSSVNNDNLANLVVSAGVLVSTDYLLLGARVWDIVAFLLLVPLAALAKRSALVIIPMGAAAALFAHFHLPDWRGATRRRVLAVSLLPAVLIVALAALAVNSEPVLAQARSVYQHLTYTSNIPALPDLAGAMASRIQAHAVSMFTSFWGAFGWQTVRLPDIVYWLLAASSGVALIGFAHYYSRVIRARAPEAVVLGFYVLIPLTLMLAVMLAFGLYDTDPANLWWGKGAPGQGRYLFPALIPIGTILMVGVRELIPDRLRRMGTAATVAALVFFNLACLFLVIVPYYGSF